MKNLFLSSNDYIISGRSRKEMSPPSKISKSQQATRAFFPVASSSQQSEEKCRPRACVRLVHFFHVFVVENFAEKQPENPQ